VLLRGSSPTKGTRVQQERDWGIKPSESANTFNPYPKTSSRSGEDPAAWLSAEAQSWVLGQPPATPLLQA